jgi:hypothetical protein
MITIMSKLILIGRERLMRAILEVKLMRVILEVVLIAMLKIEI